MSRSEIRLGKHKLRSSKTDIQGEFQIREGEKFYKISSFHQMPDFFMSIVSDSDHFMFISSNGALTAGRKNKNNALFPYYTDDKIHDYRDKTGSKSYFLIGTTEGQALWEPFTEISEKVYTIKRNIYKSIYGNKIIFEEINEDLNLSFSYGWYNSNKYGIIKKSCLTNLGNSSLEVQILDGIKNILPAGIEYAFQNEYSNLSDAYKKNELIGSSDLAIYALSSVPVDKAEPSEALLANTVWSYGLSKHKQILLSENQVKGFTKGDPVHRETDIRAKRGSYYLNDTISLTANETQQWLFAADVKQNSNKTAALKKLLLSETDLAQLVNKDINIGTENLKNIVASSDGLQCGEEVLSTSRHFSNTMYNVMRGGIFAKAYIIDKKDLSLYFKQTNLTVYKEFKTWLDSMDESIEYPTLIKFAQESKNKDLQRICTEYLPLTFSRRHGDPSRPWNNFSIETQNEDGSPKLNYEGNWRDIFQNWEALSLSYPEYLEGMITKFLNASTADGYNPYRITREGIDWEIQDPEDPWAFIGYWGDHQIIYLQKLLEQFYAYAPFRLTELLAEESYVYAHVPYEIKNYDDIVRNPKDTINFNMELHTKLMLMHEEIGADGKLFRNKNGEIVYSSFIEKILVTLLSKFSNYIPEAGIWMNTQRPEWNDANNALVGNGVSMVTLFYMRRFLVFWKELLQTVSKDSYLLSEELFELFISINETLESGTTYLQSGFSDEQRKELNRKLGEAGSKYRTTIYLDSFKGKRKELQRGKLLRFISTSLQHIDHSILVNRRSDGLYHSYNLAQFNKTGISIRHLYEMLEGQVAVLSSGYLNAEESLKVLDALKSSTLFREDQYSYILYPDRELTRFEDKNIISEEQINRSALLQEFIEKNNEHIVLKDVEGKYHFHADFRNGVMLREALAGLADEKEIETIFEIYEEIFDHQSFTGRSGTFYGYEGLGSIYWHMVSKLLLAVQECYFSSIKENTTSDVSNRLKDHYYEIKAGIGIYKSPELYGAFPTDAYSHTPANAGVKQPGLTGQVKEDVISRYKEIGIQVEKGQIYFNMSLFNDNELLKKPETFTFYSEEGATQTIHLKEGQFGCTFCQVPLIFTKGAKNQIVITYKDGTKQEISGNHIPEKESKLIFKRTGDIKDIQYNY